jgi:pilus assembly protein Flp/PilA
MRPLPLLQPLVNFLCNEDGPTAVEYAVMLALFIVVCIGMIIIRQPPTSPR